MRASGGQLSNQKAARAPHECSLLPGHLTFIFGMLALAGCTNASPAPVRVEVPVMVPCIGEVPMHPDYEFDKLPAKATDGEIIR